MSNAEITHLVLGAAGVLTLVAFVACFAVPAAKLYERIWQRAAAVFLSLYVLAALIAVGVGVGAAVIYYWDRISG